MSAPMSGLPESGRGWASAVAIGISVAAIWAVADIIAALVWGLPLAAGLDWATRRRRELAGY
jgi:hypothetical protein